MFFQQVLIAYAGFSAEKVNKVLIGGVPITTEITAQSVVIEFKPKAARGLRQVLLHIVFFPGARFYFRVDG